MRGDSVEIIVDVGGGGTERFEVTAGRAGRRVETTIGRGIIEVTEVTRGGNPVRTARFMASRVVAVVEHPADTGPVGPEVAPAGAPDGSRPRLTLTEPTDGSD